MESIIKGKLEKSLNNLSRLSSKYQEKAVIEIKKSIYTVMAMELPETRGLYCEEFGHEFGRWNPMMYDSYERICEKCGFIGRKTKEEFESERLENERKIKIRSLESELKKLKGE